MAGLKTLLLILFVSFSRILQFFSDDGTVMMLEESSTPSSDKEDGQSDVESKVNDSAEDSGSEQDSELIRLAQKADQQAVQLQEDGSSDQETVELTVEEHRTGLLCVIL